MPSRCIPAQTRCVPVAPGTSPTHLSTFSWQLAVVPRREGQLGVSSTQPRCPLGSLAYPSARQSVPVPAWHVPKPVKVSLCQPGMSPAIQGVPKPARASAGHEPSHLHAPHTQRNATPCSCTPPSPQRCQRRCDVPPQRHPLRVPVGALLRSLYQTQRPEVADALRRGALPPPGLLPGAAGERPRAPRRLRLPPALPPLPPPVPVRTPPTPLPPPQTPHQHPLTLLCPTATK